MKVTTFTLTELVDPPPGNVKLEMEPSYGFWTVLGEATRSHGHRRIRCRCKCGIERAVFARDLRTGKSNGCYSCSASTPAQIERKRARLLAKHRAGEVYRGKLLPRKVG